VDELEKLKTGALNIYAVASYFSVNFSKGSGSVLKRRLKACRGEMRVVAIVESKFKFGNKGWKMFFADLVGAADNPTLEKRPKERRGVNLKKWPRGSYANGLITRGGTHRGSKNCRN
jgi:hypothetical protein